MAEGKSLAQVVREAVNLALHQPDTASADAAFLASVRSAGYVLVSRSTLAWAKAHVVEPANFYGNDVAALAELDRVLGGG